MLNIVEKNIREIFLKHLNLSNELSDLLHEWDCGFATEINFCGEPQGIQIWTEDLNSYLENLTYEEEEPFINELKNLLKILNDNKIDYITTF